MYFFLIIIIIMNFAVPVDVSLTPTRDNTAGATDQDINRFVVA